MDKQRERELSRRLSQSRDTEDFGAIGGAILGGVAGLYLGSNVAYEFGPVVGLVASTVSIPTFGFGGLFAGNGVAQGINFVRDKYYSFQEKRHS